MKQVIRPYTIADIPRIEEWLTKQALDGYQLVSLKGWRFLFVKGKSCERKYFLYSPLSINDSFKHEYAYAKLLYGVRKSDSPLNRTHSNAFEVNIQKIDSLYYLSLESRRAYYLKHKIAMFIIELATFLFVAFLGISEGIPVLTVPLMILILIFLLNSFRCILVLRRKQRK